jgi:hypothetical protein
MSAVEKSSPWSRPQLDRSAPIRAVGGLYRTSDNREAGIPGISLTAVDDAVVAAVRMAYKVAEGQIDRSTRLARRLRDAGDRAVGPRSDRKSVDAMEQLVFRALMSGLSWFERSANEQDPVRRLMVAQYRLAGSILGLDLTQGAKASAPQLQDKEKEAPNQSTPSEPATAHRLCDAPTEVRAPRVADAQAPASRPTVILKGPTRRYVNVRACILDTGKPEREVHFFSLNDIEADPLTADLAVDDNGHVTLMIEIPRLAKAGIWRAAAHDAEGRQLGLVEIEL